MSSLAGVILSDDKRRQRRLVFSEQVPGFGGMDFRLGYAAVELGCSSRSPAQKQPSIRMTDVMNLPAEDSHDTPLLQPDTPASSSISEKLA
jgi:hypothetical protein